MNEYALKVLKANVEIAQELATIASETYRETRMMTHYLNKIIACSNRAHYAANKARIAAAEAHIAARQELAKAKEETK
jgi:hypothetical protein